MDTPPPSTPDALPARTSLLEGRSALVTGVGPGLGRDIARALAAAGSDVTLVARNEERLTEIAAEVESFGVRAVIAPASIVDADACGAAVDTAVQAMGKLDLLVNSAFRQPAMEHLEVVEEDHARKTFDVNFFGHLWMTQAAVPHLRAAAPSSVVFINTMSTRRTQPNFGLYTAAKMAMSGMAKVFAVELGGDGIRVNSVHPGYIWGPSVKWYLGKQAEDRGVEFDEVYNEVAGDTALHHLPGSDEIAQSVVFLSSHAMSSSITGESIDVNAGQYIR